MRTIAAVMGGPPPQHRPRLVVIVGPTAGGKSELAAALAQRLGGQVIGADSMQVYRRLDAGTAKPPPVLREQVPHHLIDIVEPTQRFTAADWLKLADPLIESLQAQGQRPIVVGGTNLYIKLLLEGMFQGPGQDEAFRESLREVPSELLHQRLGRVDPEAARRIHPRDRKRIIRALEVHRLTGKPISHQQRQWQEASPAPGPPESPGSSPGLPPGSAPRPGGRTPLYRHDPILIGLDWPVERINRRINARVKAMFFPEDPSLVSLPREAQELEAAGLLGPQARQALGYKQVLDWVHGRCTLEEAFERTKIQTRRYAKQQRTWLRRYRGVHWLDAGANPLEVLINQAVRIIHGQEDKNRGEENRDVESRK